MMLYNIPSAASVPLTPDVVHRLADVRNVVAIKESSRCQVKKLALSTFIRPMLQSATGFMCSSALAGCSASPRSP